MSRISSSTSPASSAWRTVAAPPATWTSPSPTSRARAQALVEAVGDEVERRAAHHLDRVARVVGEHERRGRGTAARRPTSRRQVLGAPLAPDRTEHVAAHDVGARGAAAALVIAASAGCWSAMSPMCQPWRRQPAARRAGRPRLWSGPAMKPSRDMDRWAVVKLMDVVDSPSWSVSSASSAVEGAVRGARTSSGWSRGSRPGSRSPARAPSPCRGPTRRRRRRPSSRKTCRAASSRRFQAGCRSSAGSAGPAMPTSITAASRPSSTSRLPGIRSPCVVTSSVGRAASRRSRAHRRAQRVGVDHPLGVVEVRRDVLVRGRPAGRHDPHRRTVRPPVSMRAQRQHHRAEVAGERRATEPRGVGTRRRAASGAPPTAAGRPRRARRARPARASGPAAGRAGSGRRRPRPEPGPRLRRRRRARAGTAAPGRRRAGRAG